MRTQTQEEYKNNLLDEMEEAEDFGYEEPVRERTSRNADTGKPSWYYLVTFGVTAALALGVHNLMFHSKSEVVVRGNTGFESTETVYTGNGSDILPAAFEINGVTYEMPLTFEQLSSEGWEPDYEDDVTANELRSVASGDEVQIVWSKGDMSIYTYMTPQDGVETAPIEECVSYWGDIFSDSNDEVLPYGISVGMSEEDLVEILDENVSEYTVDVYSEDGSDYEMMNDDYSVTICVIDQEVYNVYINEWNY